MAEADLLPFLVITVAAFLAGGINALAGGGSFLTLPALVFAGVPAVSANATGTAALLPGYLASAWSYRDLMRAPVGLSLLAVVIIGSIGGAGGRCAAATRHLRAGLPRHRPLAAAVRHAAVHLRSRIAAPLGPA
jgi:uncharacterized membrane protein YfcA